MAVAGESAEAIDARLLSVDEQAQKAEAHRTEHHLLREVAQPARGVPSVCVQ